MKQRLNTGLISDGVCNYVIIQASSQQTGTLRQAVVLALPHLTLPHLIPSVRLTHIYIPGVRLTHIYILSVKLTHIFILSVRLTHIYIPGVRLTHIYISSVKLTHIYILSVRLTHLYINTIYYNSRLRY